MIANLYGDSVKGTRFKHYSIGIQQGIVLHRKIDYYMDQHPAVKKLRIHLYTDLPKIAGVALDLIFDHLLAKKWDEFHHKELNVFLEEFYNHRSPLELEMSTGFVLLLKRMRESKWMNYYPTLYGLEKSALGVSGRISFKNSLQDTPRIYLKHQNIIEETFYLYMKDAVKELTYKVDLT
jgi:acyl carrier protein phosphodiesterase